MFPNLYLAFYGKGIVGDFSSMALLIAVSLLACILPLLFLREKIFFIIQSAFVLLAPFELAHIYLNRMPATSAFLLSIFDTNPDESYELLTSVKVPLILLFALWAFYFFIVFIKINNQFIVCSKKNRYCALILFVALITGISFSNYNRMVYPYDFIYRIYQVFTTKKDIIDGKTKQKTFRFNAQKLDSTDEREVYVVVIGETGRYANYSLNGYQRTTSPMLSHIDRLVSYSNFYSEANITTSSLSMILTRASARDYSRSYVEKSFVDAFKEAGFNTYWITDQGNSNMLVSRIAQDVDQAYFIEQTFADGNIFDEDLFPFLDETLSKNNLKTLIVMHTLGSHFRYNYRYPSQFEVFTPSLKGDFDYALISAKNREQFINTYDNSILYTDYFLARTIQKIDSLHAISAFVHLADHGENLFDTKENIVFHGGSEHTEFDFHIPFFVWTSSEYAQRYPAKAENIAGNKDKKLCTRVLFYSLLDMANVTFPEQIMSASIAGDTLQEDSVRYIINTNMEIEKVE